MQESLYMILNLSKEGPDTAFFKQLSCDNIRSIGLSEHTHIILNIHAYEGNNRQEQVRMFYPVINGACVVSERSARNYMDGCITECPLQYIPETIENILKNDMWKKLGDNAVYNFMRR